jgi:hypothetical protein
VVNLNVGKRIDAKEYSSMDEKGRDKFTKMAKGGSIKVNLGSGEMDLENAIKMYENKIKSQGRVTNERDENMLKQLKSMRPKMAKGGGVAFKPYGKTKGLYSITYSENGEAQSETWESLEMAMDRVKRLKKMSNVSNVKLVKPKMAKGGKTKSKQDPPVIRGYVDDEPYEYGDGGTMNCWCYEIGGL